MGSVTSLAFTKSPIRNIKSIILEQKKNILQKIFFLLSLLVHHYEEFYWSQSIIQESIRKLENCDFDIFVANDLDTLPLAIYFAGKYKSKVFFDAHEYAPLEFDNRWYWKYLHQPFREHLCRQYLKQVNVMTTVCNGIAEKYKEEYQLHPYVILNSPEYQEIKYQPISSQNNIRLIHHGNASPDRNLEKMVEIMPDLETRFELHFMLLGNPKYIQKLKILSNKIAPNRVFFHAPVQTTMICRTLSRYDLGVYLLEPLGFNYTYAMPNKLFDFIMAGLCVAIAPSLEMKKIVEDYQCGVVAKDFSPQSLAKVINALSIEEINAKKRASLEAAKVLNAEIEGQKIQKILKDLLKS
ncbi:hypothetical protein NIES208_14550 [[Limnothrix rosea] IAM M-220]|nr:hypothetical protein NIES208_14550 [[Limnothrix rosea] IAM M-220]